MIGRRYARHCAKSDALIVIGNRHALHYAESGALIVIGSRHAVHHGSDSDPAALLIIPAIGWMIIDLHDGSILASANRLHFTKK